MDSLPSPTDTVRSTSSLSNKSSSRPSIFHSKTASSTSTSSTASDNTILPKEKLTTKQVQAELYTQYRNLALEGVDIDAYCTNTLTETHESLDHRSSKYLRSLRGFGVATIPVVGGTGHTIYTGRSHAQKCVEAYGLAGRHGDSKIVKEVVEEVLKHLGIHIVAEGVVGSTVPLVSNVLAAFSAPKIMDAVLETVHERAEKLHREAIKKVKADLKKEGKLEVL